jgi:hypothetical protein
MKLKSMKLKSMKPTNAAMNAHLESSRALIAGRLATRIHRSSSVKTGFGVVSLVALGASMLMLSIGSVGCVVAATGQIDNDEKSQTEQLDTTTTTSAGDVTKLPNYEAVKTGGPGGGPDPSPWRNTVAAQSGGPDGPDPSPWDPTPNGATNTTRK